MISCKFCGGKSQKEYLYLTCEHLSCLSCAFLRADFTSQLIDCCQLQTKIDENSMQVIIKSKRFSRNTMQNKYNYTSSVKEQNNDFSDFKSEFVTEKQQPKQAEKSKAYQFNYSSFGDKSQILQTKRQNSSHLEGQRMDEILTKNLQELKDHFQAQRLFLKQRQQKAINEIMSAFKLESKNIQRPVTQSSLQKLNQLLQRKIRSINIKSTSNQQKLKENFVNETKEPNQSYDHILKKLEVNQQRMKQKIQKHLQVLP